MLPRLIRWLLRLFFSAPAQQFASLDRDKVAVGKPLGAGGFACIHRATFFPPRGAPVDAVLKQPHDGDLKVCANFV